MKNLQSILSERKYRLQTSTPNHVIDLQLASSVPGRIAFYGVIWGRFDHLEILLKVLKTSFSFLILINIDQNFHENNFWSCRPRGCKNVGPQSFAATGSRKSDVVAFPRLNLLCSGARENTRKNSKVQNCQVLRAHSFAVHWPKLTYNTSLESPDIFLYGNLNKNGAGVFLGLLWISKVASFYIIKP